MKVGILHTAFIGDVVLTGLMVEALFASGHEIIYFTKKNTAPIFEIDTRIKKVIPVEKGKGLQKLFSPQKIARQIQMENLDVLLVPHRSATSSLCAFYSKVKTTIGFQSASLAFLYKKTVSFPKEKHECIRYLNLLPDWLVASEKIKTFEKIGRPFLKYPDKIIEQTKEKLKLILPQTTNTSSFPQDFFVLAVGSVWGTKKYLVKSWVEVAFNYLRKNPNSFCLLTGSGKDEIDVDLFIKLFLEKDAQRQKEEKDFVSLSNRLIKCVNQLKLAEFAIVTSLARFVLTNDSSPIHFASSFNTPVLAVFGPTIPAFGFAPTSSHHSVVSYLNSQGQELPCRPCHIHGKHKCPQGHFTCMAGLSPNTVSAKLESLLAEVEISKK